VYNLNEKIDDEHLVKSFGQFAAENGNHKHVNIRLDELYSDAHRVNFNLKELKESYKEYVKKES
jgi:hypothetical protein